MPALAERRRAPARPVGIVHAVEPEGVAASAGVAPGDRILAVNGLVPRDVIDVRIDASAPHVELDVERDGERVVIALDKDPDEDLGIHFEDAAFDRMKTCNNACEFCFIRGLPRGLRRSLYIKDDDFRYSFLYGNFTTLTNLSEAEWQRLLFQRLGPLRVSVHATDTVLRRELLSNPRAPNILEQIDELGAHGIHIHAQIVLVPGWNDGPALEQTLTDLASRYHSVESAAVVPVGLTVHSRAQRIRPLTADDAAAAIDLVERHQRTNRRTLDTRFVYAADELYLLADRPLPGPRAYEDYPQLENGVGLIQLFRDGWKRAVRKLPGAVDPPLHTCWATGASMAPLFDELANDLRRIPGVTIEVIPVQNSMFGGQVSVAGLVPGHDVISALASSPCDRVVLPRAMFDIEGQQTIDGVSPEDIARALEREVVVGSSPVDLVEATVRQEPRTVRVIHSSGQES